jgi:hypothetical protein
MELEGPGGAYVMPIIRYFGLITLVIASLECPAFFEPVALIETGIQGANDGTTEEAYA